MFKEALIILLKSRGCWAKGGPEIPEEISAQFDLPLDDARRICELTETPNKTEQFGMTPHQAVWRLQECECYRAGLRCEGCQIAVNVLSQLFSSEEAEKIGFIEETIPAQILPSELALPNEATQQASIRWEKADVRYRAEEGFILVPVRRGEPGFEHAPFLLLPDQ